MESKKEESVITVCDFKADTGEERCNIHEYGDIKNSKDERKKAKI